MTSEIKNGESLATDERWQLIQRIISSSVLQKSARLRELLQYVTARTIEGHASSLSEQHIGESLFGKPAGYSPLEDSSVRVQARQLRLKLHEYFDGQGRDERLIVEIPKGCYAPAFRASPAFPAVAIDRVRPETMGAANGKGNWRIIVPWTLCGLLALFSLMLAVRLNRPNALATGRDAATPPWPFSQIFDARHETSVVVADSNYGMLRILSEQPGSLDKYLRPGFVQSMTPAKVSEVDARILSYIGSSSLTSFADLSVLASLIKIAGPLQAQVSVRYPKDLRMRDLDRDNYVFIGSPASNPWVTLFTGKLNFQESEGLVGQSSKAFINTKPKPGEKSRYEGLRWTGSAGEDYATIALIPSETRDTAILILQGLQQEGTEAAGRFLMDETNRLELRKQLGVKPGDSSKVWFEALIRARAFSGDPSPATLIATRRLF